MSYRLNFSNQSFHVYWLLLWSGAGKLVTGDGDIAECSHNTQHANLAAVCGQSASTNQ